MEIRKQNLKKRRMSCASMKMPAPYGSSRQSFPVGNLISPRRSHPQGYQRREQLCLRRAWKYNCRFFTIKKAMILHTPGSSADSGSMNSPTEPSTASPQTERLKEPPASVWTGLSDSAGILRSTLIRITILCQHVLEKNGFTRCGIIFTEDGSERIAFQKAGQ